MNTRRGRDAASCASYAAPVTDAETAQGTGGGDDAADLPPLIGLRAWRSKDWTPAAVDHAREAQFLDQYVEHAWRVHDVAAAALVAKAATAGDRSRLGRARRRGGARARPP